jgi:glycosyltransferase involved in cell wall biosynthesis
MSDVRPAALMLVSANADARLRAEVEEGVRPCPEFLRLEQRYAVNLLDWTALRHSAGQRCGRQSLRHAAAAHSRLRGCAAILSDGEHVGIPLALFLRIWGRRRPRHVVIGHHLLGRSKGFMFRRLGAHLGMDCVIVHSPNQVPIVHEQLAVPEPLLSVVAYGVDTDFWSPQASESEEEALIVSAGREHRDYRSLVEGTADLGPMFIADASPHSPRAHRAQPEVWPERVVRRGLDTAELRRMYARATVVVVPVVESPFPFGITTLLEAMSMGKAVIVSGTEGLRGLVNDGETGLVVAPGDPAALRTAVVDLLADPEKRRRLGQAARRTAVEQYGLDLYVDRLAHHLGLVGASLAGEPTP